MFIMPQGGAVGCTYKYSTACATVAVSCASRCSKSAGRTCGGGTAVSTGTHAHARCLGISKLHIKTHVQQQSVVRGMVCACSAIRIMQECWQSVQRACKAVLGHGVNSENVCHDGVCWHAT